MAKGKCRSALCSAHITSIMGYTRRESTRIVAVPFVRHISLLSANQRAYVLLAVMSQCPMFGKYHFYLYASEYCLFYNVAVPFVRQISLLFLSIPAPVYAVLLSQRPMFGTYHFYRWQIQYRTCVRCRSALCSAHITSI